MLFRLLMRNIVQSQNSLTLIRKSPSSQLVRSLQKVRQKLVSLESLTPDIIGKETDQTGIVECLLMLDALSMTIRMMTVVKQLPDQDVLQASQTQPPPLKVEAGERPYLWSAEEMVVDEDCEISFETLSEKECQEKTRQPLGITGSNGSLDPDSQIAPANLLARASPRTYTYSLPPDVPQDVGEGKDLRECLRLAAVGPT